MRSSDRWGTLRDHRTLASSPTGGERREGTQRRRACSASARGRANQLRGFTALFSDLRAELAHPYYPEIAVGYHGAEPVLLAETSTVNDYSLMERPVRDPSEAATDVDPREAAIQIRGLLERYLDLQPHERSNLSIMLYNCDAAGLPFATVNALGSVHDEDEMHCNVLVRHRDRPKLNRIYKELLEGSEADPDALVVSETSRNFMSKLRIGVMLDGGAPPTAAYRSVDVAFLHDVVSRQAKEAWFSVAASAAAPSLLDHVPARWSYRRVTAEDELKATNYLACPRQPEAGWAYLDAVADVVRRQSHGAHEHVLPARQISFQDQGLKGMFDEVHGLAEWVATYDDLLDKRQLAAQGINVISISAPADPRSQHDRFVDLGAPHSACPGSTAADGIELGPFRGPTVRLGASYDR